MLEDLCILWIEDKIVPKIILDYLQDEMEKSALHFSHKLQHDGTIPNKHILYFQATKPLILFGLLTTYGTKATKLLLWRAYRNKIRSFHLPRKKDKGHVRFAKQSAIIAFIQDYRKRHMV